MLPLKRMQQTTTQRATVSKRHFIPYWLCGPATHTHVHCHKHPRVRINLKYGRWCGVERRGRLGQIVTSEYAGSPYTAECHGAQKSKSEHIYLFFKILSHWYHFYVEFSCHSLQAARGLLSESNKASPCCSVVCLMLFCESNHVLWSSVSICFLDPRSIWWYGIYLLKQQATVQKWKYVKLFTNYSRSVTTKGGQ